MKKTLHQLTVLCLLLIGFHAQAQQVDIVVHATGFTNPVDIANAGDDRLFIVEQAGRIKIIDVLGVVNPTPYLNIVGIVNDGQNEQGLLGLAFHPNYAVNGFFYVNYTAANGSTQISRFTVDGGNPDLGDPASEVQILNIAQPFGNHNGGCIRFGPDGYLYIGMGDGGSGGDPGDRAQDPLELLGKMLRIDVDGGSPYVVPATNPFVGVPGTLDEIWAIGVRNPWKFTFDALTGDMWIGDVGQNAREEIDMQPAASTGGENYGWRCYEASANFNLSGCPGIGTFTFPAYEYTQSGSPGGCSVTGGVVYRGSNFPLLNGHYFLSDYCGDWIQTVYDNAGTYTAINHGTWPGQGISSFGEDNLGEVYASALFTGIIYKIADVTSIDEIQNNNVTGIYPNPFDTKTTVNFNYEEGESYKLDVYDVSGKHVLTISEILNEEIIVDLEKFMQGMYTFQILKNGTLDGRGKLMVK